VKEGLELSEKALKINPDHYYSLHAKGWGLYKTGKFKEAVEILQKSMESSPIYRHTIFKHLEEAKKAAASEI
jgi:tetratricopeptide (TPR) repeat protein